MKNVVVLIGAGSIGVAIARRVSAGKHLLLADIKLENAELVAKTLTNAGFEVSTTQVDVSSRESINSLIKKAKSIGDVVGLIHSAGVSPSQAPIQRILEVDLYGTALVLEEFGKIMASGGAGVIIASMAGHRIKSLNDSQIRALATTPVEKLLDLPMLQVEKIENTTEAYCISKQANSLRVLAQAVEWGKRGARINTISPGIIITPLANDELNGPLGDGYRHMLNVSAAGRAGTPDEVGNVGAFLMSAESSFITGSDFLMDGGVTAAYWFGDLAPKI